MRALIFKLYRLQYRPEKERWVLTTNGRRVKHFANKAKAISSLAAWVKAPGVVEVCRKDGTRQGYRYYDRKRSKRV